MTKTYRSDTPVGPMGRWLPSIAAAKKRYSAARCEDEPKPVVTFETSIEDEHGRPCKEHLRCLDADGRWESTIAAEPPAWPSWDSQFGKSPELALRRVTGPHHCPHERLICSDICAPGKDRPEPQIRCASCYTTWKPES